MLGECQLQLCTWRGGWAIYLCSSKMNRASIVLMLLNLSPACHAEDAGGVKRESTWGWSRWPRGSRELERRHHAASLSALQFIDRRKSASLQRPTSRATAMAIEVAPPTFKEALKQDRAQFDDCTPCRVVGMLDTRTPSAAAQ